MTPVWTSLALNLTLHDSEQLIIDKQIIASLSGAIGVRKYLISHAEIFANKKYSLAEK
jgi:hypothetical protein